MSRKGKVEFEYNIVALEELIEADRSLVEQAKQARKSAHAPYSLFQVGAAARLSSGHIVLGSNQENRSFPAGLCAERVCLFNAMANHGHTLVTTLAVVAYPANSEMAEPAHPCGGCRQVMLEVQHKQKAPFRLLLLYPNDEVLVLERASDLMPLPFESDI